MLLTVSCWCGWARSALTEVLSIVWSGGGTCVDDVNAATHVVVAAVENGGRMNRRAWFAQHCTTHNVLPYT